MLSVDDLLKAPPFEMPEADKAVLQLALLKDLCASHVQHCKPYHNILRGLGSDLACAQSLEELPFLPVSIFKELELKSIPDSEVFKQLTSSGTSGQAVSRIFLSRENVLVQQRALINIVSAVLGKKRMPMIVLDTSAVLKDRHSFSARTAGITGFSIFARGRIFALNENMQLDLPGIESFLAKHAGESILLFGFTFMVWQYFYSELKRQGIRLKFPAGSILLHGGGWKKLAQQAVSKEEFKSALTEQCALDRICDYYGMAEQTGSIYMECEYGHLHCSNLSNIIIRRASDFSCCNIGEEGLIETISLLPVSYPGNLLLTEDRGVLLGIDDCPCGRKGRYFNVLGRVQNAEIRGCSDTYAAGFAVR